jgi:hypothetical protein
MIQNFDVKCQRLKYALKAVTFGSKRQPKGRKMLPQIFCRLDFHLTVPLGTGRPGFQEIFGNDVHIA